MALSVGPRWEFPAGVIVEQARPRDSLLTLALHRSVLAEGQWFLTSETEFGITVEDRDAQIRATASHASQLFVVARLPGTSVAGFAVVTTGPLLRMRTTGRLELMVGSAHRGRGLGTALMSACVSWAESSPLHKLGLAVFADNDRAIALGFGQVQELAAGRAAGRLVAAGCASRPAG